MVYLISYCGQILDKRKHAGAKVYLAQFKKRWQQRRQWWQKHAAAAGREQSQVDAGAQHLSLIPSGIRAV